MKLTAKIEAVLYIKGQPLTLDEIADCLDCDRDFVESGIIDLMNDYAHRDSSLEILETNLGYALQLKSTYRDLVRDLIPAELGKGALRTLAAIAMKNPILQTDLINLRGSSAYQQVSELVDFGLIRKRPQNDGRSYWLEVTDKFHQYFEVDRLDRLLVS